MPNPSTPTLADYAKEEEDYLVCDLCGDWWSLDHVCWQVERRWAITLAHTIIKELDD